MAQENRLYNSVATLGNVVALVELVMRLQTRTSGLPGMATFSGFSGFGKTTAALYACNKFGAHAVQVKSQWTKRYFCESLAAELSIDIRRSWTVPRLIDAVSESLARSGNPLIIDEADILVDRGMIEITRDIYEGSGVPVILIGEEKLPKKLEQFERIHGRMLDWVAAQPGTVDDVQLLAPLYCPKVTLSADAVDHVLREARNSIRRICNNLDRVREYAATRGIRDLDGAEVRRIRFAPADAPAPRRMAA